MPVLSVFIPAVSGICLLFLKNIGKKSLRMIAFLSLLASVICCAGSCFLGGSVSLGEFAGGLSLSFGVDSLSVFFAAAGCLVFLLSCVFSFEYMKREEHENRFYGFLILSFAGFIGMTFSANLFTAYLFFEVITLSSFPLVLHEQTSSALFGGEKYLFYSIGGSLLALFGIFVLSFVGVSGFSSSCPAADTPLAVAGVFYCVIGFGAKAGMFPMQSWLPSAHPVAPAPASAILSGIITKAGIFMICRILYFCGGKDVIRGTWAQNLLIFFAMVTVLMGSVLALREKDIKKRLAFSTVSQTSYILLGFLSLTAEGAAGGLLHVMLHCLAKTVLFLAAGAVIFKTGVRDVDAFGGLGRKMPVVMFTFTLASLALVGVPPTVGFSSKWYITAGAFSGGLGCWEILIPAVLLISAVFTAGYLLPVSVKSFFIGGEPAKTEEAPLLMTLPLVLLSVLTVAFGLFSGVLFGWFVGIFAF